jgi:hypothetical protein
MKIAKRITILLFICTVAFWLYGKEQREKQDMTAPVISSTISELHVDASLAFDEYALKEGLRASDDVDGDITRDIIVGTISPFIEKGISDVEYVVFDSSNNVGRYERTVYFENYESPKLHLSKALVYEVNGRINISDRLTAIDMLEGDISGKIRFSSGNLTVTEEGTYKLNVELKNSYGDTVKEQLPINLVRYNCAKELIQLKEYLIYLKVQEDFAPEDYIENVTNRTGEEVDITNVVITREVDLTQAGTGQIRYELLEGEEVVYATYLTIIVTE